MRTEVHFGGFTHWVSYAGSPLHAACETLKECINQWNTFPRQPFRVIDLDTDEEHVFSLADVVRVLALGADYDPDALEPEPPLDPNCDIMRAARQAKEPAFDREAWIDGCPALRGYR